MADPLRTWRRLTRATMIAGAALCAGAGWFAFGPIPSIDTQTPVPTVTTGDDTQTERDAGTELDAEVFDIVLWSPPPVPIMATKEEGVKPPSHPPLRLQLLAIRDTDGIYSAIVYDESNDAILEIVVGQTVQSFDVTEIAAHYVRLERGRNTQTLELKRPGDDVMDALRDIVTISEGDA
jgi:hypothetical protein